MKRINKGLILISGIALFSVIFLVVSIQKFSPLVNHVAYYCKSFVDTNMVQIPYFLTIIPIALICMILAISCLKFLILSFKVQLLKRTLKGKITGIKTANRLIQQLGLSDTTLIVKSSDKFAFCLGIRNPKIYISTGLISQLTMKELEATLRHEEYHVKNKDSVTSIIASVVYSLSPLFPLLRDFMKWHRIEREIQADKYAVEKVGDPSPLISVIRKFIAFPTMEMGARVSIADQDTLEPRICSLINKEYKKKQIKLAHVFFTLVASVVIGIVVVFPVHATEIHHEDHDVIMVCTSGECMNSCMTEQNLQKLYSEIPSQFNNIPTLNSSQPFTPIH